MVPLRTLVLLWSLAMVAPTSAHPGNRQEVVSPATGAEYNWERALEEGYVCAGGGEGASNE